MNTIIRGFIWMIMLIPLIYLATCWNTIPQTVAMHFDFNGNIDRYASKNELLILMAAVTGVNMLIYLLLLNVYRIDPKKYAYQNKDRMGKIAFTVAVFLTIVFMLIVYSSIHENLAFSAGMMLAAMFFLFALIGNYMYSMKPNYFAGFRLPWTLSNEENWKKTHQLAGRLWFFSGLFIGMVLLFLSNKAALITGGIALFIMICIPVIYSYKMYSRQKFAE